MNEPILDADEVQAGEVQPSSGGVVVESCHHLTLHRILILGIPHYQCGACDKIFNVPELFVITVETP